MNLLDATDLTTVSTDLSANVVSSIGSVWTIVLLAVSIPLAFYIIGRVIGLFPKGR